MAAATVSDLWKPPWSLCETAEVLAKGVAHDGPGSVAPLELLEALKVDADDVVRQAVESVFQALIDAEATARIGAAAHERTPARVAQRNGYRELNRRGFMPPPCESWRMAEDQPAVA